MDIQSPHTLAEPAHLPKFTARPANRTVSEGLRALSRASCVEASAPAFVRPHSWLRMVALSLGFFILYAAFYGIWIALPYLSSGSDVVFHTKLRAELHSQIFSTTPARKKLLIFGTSKVLAGFIPSQFDNTAAQQGLFLDSFNSGYPARDTFVPELARMTAAGTVPDVLLLTESWSSAQASSFFRPIENEHALADTLFPFRHLVRDGVSFLQNARHHGGPANYYQLAHHNVDRMMQDRGYYFIAEQSHFPGDRLPEAFSLPTDNPHHIAARTADPQAPQALELGALIARYRMRCLYVAAYARIGAVAAAPDRNPTFAHAAAQVGCTVIGSDYVRYPNALFSDEIHLNRAGAEAYTADLLRIIEKEQPNALQ